MARLTESSVNSLDELLTEARNGDRVAFDRLIRRFEKNVMKTALLLTGSMDDAQDVAQEVFIKLIRNMDSLDGLRQPEAWFYRVTVNAAHDYLRKRRLWLPLKRVFQWVGPADPIRQREIRSRLTQAMKMLSFQERAAFVLKEIHDMNTEEVAEALGCQAVTVRGHLLAARRKLRSRLGDLREPGRQGLGRQTRKGVLR